MSDSLRPHDYNLPGSSVHGTLQARRLEWVAIPFSKGSSWSKDQSQVSCIIGKFFTLWATKEAQSNKPYTLHRVWYPCLLLYHPKEIGQKLGLLFLNNTFLQYNHDFNCYPYSAPEKTMATHSSTLAWKIPWAEEPHGLLPMGVTQSWTRLKRLSSSSSSYSAQGEYIV